MILIGKPCHHIGLARLLKRNGVEEEISMILANKLNGSLYLAPSQWVKRVLVVAEAVRLGLDTIDAVDAIDASFVHAELFGTVSTAQGEAKGS